MVKYKFWSVKGYLTKKRVKKRKKKKRVKKRFCAKNLPNVLKNKVFGGKNPNVVKNLTYNIGYFLALIRLHIILPMTFF